MKNQESRIKNIKIKKDDNVQILLGKDRGKTGKVLRIWSKEEKALVEGINMVKRHVRKTREHEGGVLDLPKPINVSNLAIVCPACKKISRVGFKVEGSKKMRICKKCQEVIK